jgi:hypothetical protein
MKISEMVGTTSGKKPVDQFEFGRFIANNSAASTCFTLGWMTNESADKSTMHPHVKLACFVRKSSSPVNNFRSNSQNIFQVQSPTSPGSAFLSQFNLISLNQRNVFKVRP